MKLHYTCNVTNNQQTNPTEDETRLNDGRILVNNADEDPLGLPDMWADLSPGSKSKQTQNADEDDHLSMPSMWN